MQRNSAAFLTPLPTLGRSQLGSSFARCGRPATTLSTCTAPRRAAVSMRSAERREQKAVKIEVVKELLSKSHMIFSVPLPGITVGEMLKLRRSLPEGTTCCTVKNTLMRQAMEGTDWQVAGDQCKNSIVWFFVEEDMKKSIKAYEEFSKEYSRDAIIAGVLEKVLYDSKGVSDIAKLPSKSELYAQIAFLVKAVPTKLARSIKAVPTKLAGTIKLAVGDPAKTDSAPATD